MKHKFLLWVCILLSIVVRAQDTGDIDSTFKIGKSFSKSGSINAIAVQTDGKLIVAGTFNSYDQISANDIVRLNADGTIDNTFNSGTGFIGNVKSMAVQSDGKILVGGEYNSFNGLTANNIIRLNTNGSRDNSFNMGTGCNSYVYSISIQGDGKIILGGFFSDYNGTAVNGIARLNLDGTIDNTFNSTTGSFILTTAIQSDGKILVGDLGSVFRLNSDGTVDPSFTINSSVSLPSVISIQSDGKILIGAFDSIVRLNSDGSNDSTFNSGTGFNSIVNSIKIQSDGKIIAGGAFTSYNGTLSDRVIRLNSDGTVDHIFNFGPQPEVNIDITDSVNSIFILSDGKMLIAGSTTSYSAQSISGLIKVDSAGVKDNTFNIKNAAFEVYSASANCSVEQSDGKIIVGGNFNYYFGTLSSGIVRLNGDGTRDTSFNTGTGLNNEGGSVTSISVQSDGKIIVAGRFSSFNGITAGNIIRLNTDGTIDNTFTTGAGFNSTVNAISIQPDGKILAAGEFNGYDNVFITNIIRLNSDGTMDNSFNVLSFSTIIKSMALQSDGKILVGGTYFVRLNQNGTVDNTFHTGGGFNILTGMGGHAPDIVSIVIQTDGKILVAGSFNNYDGTTIKEVVRLNSDGTIDAAFIPETDGSINCVAIQSDGKILIGITTDFSTASTNIVRLNLNGKIDPSFDVHLFDKVVNNIMVQKDGKIIALGVFSNYDATTCMGIVRLLGDSFLFAENFSLTKIALYPNPASDRINIQSPSDVIIDRITIIDLTGKVLLHQSYSKEINVGELASGVYIMEMTLGEMKWQSKFIKE